MIIAWRFLEFVYGKIKKKDNLSLKRWLTSLNLSDHEGINSEETLKDLEKIIKNFKK